jgi:hypothetical protein
MQLGPKEQRAGKEVHDLAAAVVQRAMAEAQPSVRR